MEEAVPRRYQKQRFRHGKDTRKHIRIKGKNKKQSQKAATAQSDKPIPERQCPCGSRSRHVPWKCWAVFTSALLGSHTNHDTMPDFYRKTRMRLHNIKMNPTIATGVVVRHV
jgi:hypothetical protein